MSSTPPMSARLASVAEAIRQRRAEPHSSPKEANITHAFFRDFADLPLAERQARSMAYALANEPIHYLEGEAIAGQVFQGCPGSGDPLLNGTADPALLEASGGQWPEFCVAGAGARWVAERLPEHALYGRWFSDGAAPGHIGWDWRLVLGLGLEGLLERYQAALASAPDDQAAEFHHCACIALEGAIAFADRLAEGASPDLQPLCRRVPRQPSTTFREAVQAFWTQYLAVMFENPYGGNGPGLVDRFLWPYLERDLAAGRTTLDEARDLVRELFLKLDERIHPHDGWVEAICVGGQTSDGRGAESPLSHMMVETIMELNQTHPSVYIRLRDDAPASFRRLAADYIIRGGNRAQVYGDDRVVEALVASGHRREDACEWMAGGCMEVSSQARNCDFNFAYAHNAAWTLEAVLYGGSVPHLQARVSPLEADLTAYSDFDDLFTAFEAEMRRELDLVFRRLDIYFEAYAKYRPAFLVSTMVHDCLERGRTLNDGGARYADFCGSVVAIPDVADSLLALKIALFDQGFCTPQELLAALRSDFVGYEALRARLSALPKYGQDDPEADALCNRVLGIYCDACDAHRTPHGGRVRPLVLGFVWVAEFGAITGALPDGRKAGQPLAHGLAPQGGAAIHGLSAALNSATSLDLVRVPGGASMMFDLDTSWATPDVVEATLMAFVRRGGHIFQGNTSDFERLEDALKHPDRHRDLMVRVGGFSARFVNLSPVIQQEIVARRRYAG